MNRLRLEDRFRNHVSKINSFWFTYFAITYPMDKDSIDDGYFNSEYVSLKKVGMYCDMWGKGKWN